MKHVVDAALLALSFAGAAGAQTVFYAGAAPVYHIEEISPKGAEDLVINNHGSVTGAVDQAAFLATKQGDLKKLPARTWGTAINESDNITVASTVGGEDYYRCGLWNTTTNVNSDLGTLGGHECFPSGVIDQGVVVGWSNLSNGRQHAFVSDGITMTDLGTLGGLESSAAAINNKGLIAGTSDLGGGAKHAFVAKDGVLTDIGTLGGTLSSATGINQKGHVIGTSLRFPGERNKHAHAFLWNGLRMHNLGTLGGKSSYPYSINRYDEVVGWSQNAGKLDEAFLYTGGVMYNLYDLLDSSRDGWGRLIGGSSINDEGDIVGFAFRNNELTYFIARRVSN